MQKDKWLSEQALQIAENEEKQRQRGKGKIHPSECRVPKNAKERDKKAFLSDQCKDIEENNKMGKTTDLFRKLIDTNGAFHAKMGTIKDRKLWT